MSNAPLLHQGLAHHQSGRVEEAKACYRQVLAEDPAEADALHLLGVLIHQEGDAEGGVAMVRKALGVRPNLLAAWGNLARMLESQGKVTEADHLLQQALFRWPEQEGLWCQRAQLAERTGGAAAAADVLESACKAMPRSGHLRYLYGARLALPPLSLPFGPDHLAAACRLAPGHADAHALLGALWTRSGRHEEGMALLRRALHLDPSHAAALGDLAQALLASGLAAEAGETADRALALEPGQALARVVKGHLALAQGRLAEGWEGFAARTLLARSGSPGRRSGRPAWDGVPAPGRRILVWREEGLGDEIRFASCLRDLLATGVQVVLEGSDRLLGLYARAFPGIRVARFGETADEDFDAQLPIGGLPGLYRRSLEDFPRDSGRFLAADPALAPKWRDRVAGLGEGLKVGICWKSQNQSLFKAVFSADLKDWGPVLRRPGLTFVNLQYGDWRDDKAEAERLHGVRIHGWDDLDTTNDFEGLAALMEQLDVVVTARTTVAALAGGLGKPCLLYVTDPNSLMLGQRRDPWFPTCRIFHVERATLAAEGWSPTLAHIADALTGQET